MNEPRPLRPRPGPRSGPQPVHRPAPHAPPPKKAAPGKGMWIAIGAGAVVVVLVAVVMMSGKKPAEEPVAVKPPPEKAAPKTPPPPPPPPPKAPPPPIVQPPPPPPKKPPQDPVEARKEELAEKAKLDRAAGAARLAEARASVEKDLEREKAEAEAFQKRFAELRLDIKLTSNQEYKQALVTGFNEDELRIKPPDRDTVILPWLMVAPESVSTVAHRVYRSETADDLLALARFCVERRLWKEAQAALQKLKKVDEDQERMVERFEEVAAPLVTGKGLFQGALKTNGPTGLRLAYDLSDPAQADDFKGTSEGITLEAGKLTLESDKPHAWVVGDPDLEFWEEVDIEGAANFQGALLVLYNQRPAQDFYVLELGPAGIVLKKGKSPGTAKELSKNAKAVVKGDQKFKVTIRRRKVSVTIAGRPAFSFEDPDGDGDTRGRLQVGVSGGKVVFSPGLVIDGQANPDYLKKKIGTIEMEARRSISKDLGDVRELNAQQAANRILGGSSEGISADELSLEFINPQELPAYNDVKLALSFRLDDGKKYQDAMTNLDQWLEKRAGFPSLWYLAGIRHINHSQLGEARDKFAKAIALFPNFYEAHYQTARTWWYAREFAKALEEVKKAIALRPDYAAAHVLMGQMLFAVDKKASKEADMTFRIAEKLDADASEMLHERRRVRMVTRGPRDLGCVFEQESANYLIVTDISAERAKWYASQLEVVRASYLDAFKKWYGGDPRPKPRIAIFNTREAFYTYTELSSTDRRENVLGFFDPANNELVLFEDLDLEDTLQVLYHEAFHHFASAMLKFPPYWWNEGIAEYMSAVKLDPQGREIKERARMLAGRLVGMKMALVNDYYVPFEQIINYSPGQFYSGNVGLHYAQAWTMIHFLYEFENGKYRPLIQQYFDELVNGKTQRQAYDAVFEGKTDELEKEWLKFTKALKVPKR